MASGTDCAFRHRRGGTHISGEDEDDLLERFREGDIDACRQVECWARNAVARIQRDLPPERREVVIHESVEDAWIAAMRPDFKIRESLAALVTVIVRRRRHRFLRSMRRSVRWFQPFDETRSDPPDPGPAPDVALAFQRQRSALRTLIAELDPEMRELIRLHIYENMSFPEVAAVLGVPAPALRVRFHRLIKRMRTDVPSMGARP